MLPNRKFQNQDLEFWANVKFVNQKLGYSKKATKKNPNPGFVIPTVEQIIDLFEQENLNNSKLVEGHNLTQLGELVVEYISYRGTLLTDSVKPLLMDKNLAKSLFTKTKNRLNPTCPLPMNKQKGEKKGHAYLTGLVNMLIEENKGDWDCDYDPKELTSIIHNQYPIRTFSRRVDGAFPSVKTPKAIWEIKEYYYTTTFGSRVADGVYETQLDGMELIEARMNTGFDIKHYLIVDDHYTWWVKGRSYLCRLIDLMHMGLVTEVVFGKEVMTRIPELVQEWIHTE